MSEDPVPMIINNLNMHPHQAVCLDTDKENGHPILNYIYALKNYYKIKQVRLYEKQLEQVENEMKAKKKWAENNIGMDQVANILSR